MTGMKFKWIEKLAAPATKRSLKICRAILLAKALEESNTLQKCTTENKFYRNFMAGWGFHAIKIFGMKVVLGHQIG